GLIVAVFVGRLREPRRGVHDAPTATSGSEEKHSWWRTTVQIFTTRNWLLSTAGYTALTFVLGAFATGAVIMLVRDKHMSDTSAGIVLGSVSLVGGAAGTFCGGWIADRVVAKRRNGYFLVCAASSFFGIFPAVLALVTHQPIFFVPAIFLAVFLLFTNNAPF